MASGAEERGILPQTFYQRDAIAVAKDLLGQELCHDDVVLRITEVEAYCPGDSANHCHRGRTARNEPMWGPGGHAYVYLCYGLHQMLNLVTGPEGSGEAVLIRSCEPMAGMETIRSRRGGKDGPVLLTGPGKVGAALAVDQRHNRHPVFLPGGLTVRRGKELAADRPSAGVLHGPRVGIDYAEPEDRTAKWRFALADSVWVSHRNTLEAI